MFHAITAYSVQKSVNNALQEIKAQCIEQLGIYRPIAGILYYSHPHHKEIKPLLNGINKAFPNIQLVGFSTVAGFTQSSGYFKEGCFLTLITSDSVTISSCIVHDIAELQTDNKLEAKLEETLAELRFREKPKVCLLFPDFANINGNDLLNKLQNVLPESCQVFGGYASDFWSENDIECFPENVSSEANTQQYFIKNGEVEVCDNATCCMFLSGPLEVQSSCSYGWSDTGTKYRAKVTNSTFIEIDGMEPIEFLRKNQHPLGYNDSRYSEYVFWVHENGKDPYLRDIFYDLNSKHLYTANEFLPENFLISFSFPDTRNVIKEYTSAVHRIQGIYDLVLTFTCASHVPLLRDGIQEEHSQQKTFFPRTAILAGYVYGEFGPLSQAERSILHSCSSITVALKEKGDTKVSQPIKNKEGTNFLHDTIRAQKKRIESLEKELHFFESSKNNKKAKFTEDCLGLILNNSNRSVTAYADQLSNIFKSRASSTGVKSPYPMSRNRIIEHLMKVKDRAKKKFLA